MFFIVCQGDGLGGFVSWIFAQLLASARCAHSKARDAGSRAREREERGEKQDQAARRLRQDLTKGQARQLQTRLGCAHRMGGDRLGYVEMSFSPLWVKQLLLQLTGPRRKGPRRCVVQMAQLRI